MARLILDTGIVVAAVRGRIDLGEFGESDDVALPAVSIAEYLTGVELNPDPARQAAHAAFLDELLAVMPVIDYTRAVAVHHAELLAHVRRVGQPRGARDLIIAATARASDRILVSTDAQARFDELPEVRLRLVKPG